MPLRPTLRIPVRKTVRAAAIAAVYVALCATLPLTSYGPVQVRLAEALTLLPILCPEAVVGVALGCFLSNMLAGIPLDMAVGTAATLLAALATRRLRKLRWRKQPLAAALPPIVFNALIVGAELSFLFPLEGGAWATLPFYMGTVGLGQLIACGGLGLLLVWSIERSPQMLRLFADTPPADRLKGRGAHD